MPLRVSPSKAELLRVLVDVSCILGVLRTSSSLWTRTVFLCKFFGGVFDLKREESEESER